MEKSEQTEFLENVYNTINASAEQARKNREALGIAGLPLFELNCDIWLSPILKDMDRIDDAEYLITEGGSVKFIKTFIWHGMEGAITSHPWGYGWNTFPRAGSWLEFVLVDPAGIQPPRKVNIKLPSEIDSPNETGKYDERALPVEKTPLAALLVEVSTNREKINRYGLVHKQRILLESLQSCENDLKAARDIADVQVWLAGAMRFYPDFAERWNAAAKRRSDELIAETIRRKAAEEEAAAITSEEQALEEQAAALFKPFTVYRLRLLIETADQEKPYFTYVYVTKSVPDEAGYYVEVNHGDLIPGYRPQSPIVDLRRLEIDTPYHPDAPDICRHVEITGTRSIKSIVALASPEGLG